MIEMDSINAVAISNVESGSVFIYMIVCLSLLHFLICDLVLIMIQNKGNIIFSVVPYSFTHQAQIRHPSCRTLTHLSGRPRVGPFLAMQQEL